MSFKDFSTSHSERKSSPLAAKPEKPMAMKGAQPLRAPVSKPHAPRQSAPKH